MIPRGFCAPLGCKPEVRAYHNDNPHEARVLGLPPLNIRPALKAEAVGVVIEICVKHLGGQNLI